MLKLVQFGTGNIARALMGQLFSRAGYEVVFVGRNRTVVDALNRDRKYFIQVKDRSSEEIWVENVRAVLISNEEKVIEEIASADLMATAVGPNSLPQIYEVIATGIKRRKIPLNILICENLRRMSHIFRKGIEPHFPKDYPLSEQVGFIETSIGKMVPIMPEEIRQKDPTRIWAEAYNLLLVDQENFIGKIPEVEGMMAKANFDAYVDQKLFIHNLGHSATAYLGYFIAPESRSICRAISTPYIEKAVKAAMWESANALIREYPSEFDEQTQREYIDDLIRRFKNPFLNDTFYRVGRDLPRKLGPSERFIRAARMDVKYGILPRYTVLAIGAAFFFRATDEKGELFENDRRFHAEFQEHGIDSVLEKVCKLDPQRDQTLGTWIRSTYTVLRKAKVNFSLINRGACR